VSRLPTRLRLTLVFALVMAVVLAGAGWLVYARVATDLGRALNQDLRSRAQDLSALVKHGGSLRTTAGPLVEHGETFAQVLDARRRVLDGTPPNSARPLLSGAELARARGGPVFVDRPSVPGLNEPARMLALPVERNGDRLVLVAGATRENRAETLRALRAAFLVGGPIALLLASLAGYLLAGAALRPIEAMRRRAEEISTSSLDERLPVPATRDEVARLGATLNDMLARIEEGLAREHRFVTDASHELRTPLSLLKTELELALRHDRPPAELEQAVRSAADEVDRLERIADDLLLLARSEEGLLELRLEPTDLADVLETVRSRFATRAASEGRELSIVPAEAQVVVADRLRLEQALGNMVDNALRHGAGPVALSSEPSDGGVEVHVRDGGDGFPAAFLPQAFERFSRAAARGAAGSGLGLAIVETVARAHHGSAHAGNGSTGGDVWIRLPTD
jgi:signal transduction histidine kinase